MVKLVAQMAQEEDGLNRAVFRDEDYFYLSGKVNRHNVKNMGYRDSTRGRRTRAGPTKTVTPSSESCILFRL